MHNLIVLLVFRAFQTFGSMLPISLCSEWNSCRKASLLLSGAPKTEQKVYINLYVKQENEWSEA